MLVTGPAKETRKLLFLLLMREKLTGTGFAHPKTPNPLNEVKIGTIIVPTKSMCETGFKVNLPAFFAVSSPKSKAVKPCEISWRIIDGKSTANATNSGSNDGLSDEIRIAVVVKSVIKSTAPKNLSLFENSLNFSPSILECDLFAPDVWNGLAP